MNANHENVAALFDEALKLKPAERAAFLAGACGNDSGLRDQLEELLRAEAEAGDFLPETPNDAATVVMPLTEKPGDRIGRYKLLEKIGEGGCGVVYMAEQEEPVRRRVALKIIKLGLETKSVIARFEAERQALAMMDHPNIAKVFDGGVTGATHPQPLSHSMGEGGRRPDDVSPSPGGEGRGEGGFKSAIDNRKSEIPRGRPYFVMELVRGIRITDYCAQHNLSTRERLDLFIQVCSAIQHAHQKGVIHRDIKPSNVLVTENDGRPVPKVIDFGIAKATEQKLTDKTLFTQFAAFIGTPAYMSPEQAALTSVDIDTRADIYSLGVLLYELLTGTTPFDAQELLKAGFDEMRRVIRETEPERPSTRLTQRLGRGTGAHGLRRHATALPSPRESPAATGMPACSQRGVMPPQSTESPRAIPGAKNLIHQLRGDLDWIVMKCLEKDRTRRYESASNLAGDLQRHLDCEPVVARPPSFGYRLLKFGRRHRQVVIGVTAIGVSLVVGTGVSLWQAVEAVRARQAAEKARDDEAAQRRTAEIERTNALRNAYAANLLLAQTDWDNNNLSRFHQALDETAAFGPRGFEWIYWQRLGHQDRMTLRGHSDTITSVAISPDGRRAASGSSDHTARIWDLESGRELARLEGHADYVWRVMFSPDGRRLATVSADQTARVWDVETGRVLLVLAGHVSGVPALAYSPDGRWLATGSKDRTIKVWDAATGLDRFTLAGHEREVWAVTLARDGQRLASARGDKVIRIYEAASPAQASAWSEQARAARAETERRDRERQAESERHRAEPGGPATISSWLLAGPFPVSAELPGSAGLDEAQLPGEARLTPRAGDRAVGAVRDSKWNEAHFPDGVIDFQRSFGGVPLRCAAYAVTYLHAEREWDDVVLKVGSDDQARVWLNRELVYEERTGRPFEIDTDAVAGIRLRRGWNVIVFKVLNQAGEWKGALRLTDRRGRPLTGLTTGLAPP